jgi:hypothetical protein
MEISTIFYKSKIKFLTASIASFKKLRIAQSSAHFFRLWRAKGDRVNLRTYCWLN